MIRHLRNSVRLCEVAWVLARHGALRPFLQKARASPLAIGLAKRLEARSVRGRDGERVARALIALGPTFVKFGQSLATRADLLGEETAHDLRALQDRVPPFSAADARASVEEALEDELDALYVSFEDEPVAAASIAQVHFAVTRDGDEVAVKVLRPGVEDAIERDLALFDWIARFATWARPDWARFKLVEVVATFAIWTRREMDLRLEAAAASELAENCDGDYGFRVPKVDWPRTARRVLTIERVRGLASHDRAAMVEAGLDPAEVLRRAAEIFFLQVFRDGFFHADMHPGNVFVDPETGELTPVDFGIMGRIDRPTRRFLAEMLMGFLNRDYRRVADVHFEAGYVPADQDRDAFMQACRAIGEPILGKPSHEISVGRLLGQLLQVTEQFRMETQLQLLLLQKTMVVAEGVGRSLEPRINMWRLAQPLIESWIAQNLGPAAIAKDTAADGLVLVKTLPRVFKRLDERLAEPAAPSTKRSPDPISARIVLVFLFGLTLGALLS